MSTKTIKLIRKYASILTCKKCAYAIFTAWNNNKWNNNESMAVGVRGSLVPKLKKLEWDTNTNMRWETNEHGNNTGAEAKFGIIYFNLIN